MKATEIRELTIKEINEHLETERTFLAKQRLNHAVSPLDNPLKLNETRKNIARLMTILREKELNENK